MLHTASVQLRVFYCLAVLGAVLPFGMSSWTAMTVGANPMPVVPYFGPLVLLVVGIWRIFQVGRVSATLDSYVYGGALRALRVIGLIAMGVGVLYLIVRLAVVPLLGLLVPRQSGSAGVGFYVLGVYLWILGGVGPLGILLFETSRLFGFERQRHLSGS
jgi:hypothetical protein